MSFNEPIWGSGKNDWSRFHRAGVAPWDLAGLWNTWTRKTTGEVVESYTMTLNADLHSVMYRMHKPDPELGPDQQDKRSVVPIEPGDVDTCGSLNRRSPLQRGQACAGRNFRCRPRRTMTADPCRSGNGALVVEGT